MPTPRAAITNRVGQVWQTAYAEVWYVTRSQRPRRSWSPADTTHNILILYSPQPINMRSPTWVYEEGGVRSWEYRTNWVRVA